MYTRNQNWNCKPFYDSWINTNNINISQCSFFQLIFYGEGYSIVIMNTCYLKAAFGVYLASSWYFKHDRRANINIVSTAYRLKNVQIKVGRVRALNEDECMFITWYMFKLRNQKYFLVHQLVLFFSINKIVFLRIFGFPFN